MGANSSKMYLIVAITALLKISYSNLEYGKGQIAPPKYLFYAVVKIEKDPYTLIEQSVYLIWQLLTSQNYRYII